MQRRPIMSVVRCLIALFLCAAAAHRAYAADEAAAQATAAQATSQATAQATAQATLFRVFLIDGTSIVAYGEFARVADQVVLSVPVGGTAQDPRLQAVTLAASRVDWEKTDRHAASTRYQRYVATRAEADYRQLTDEVAGVLSSIAQSTDRPKALAAAEQARRMLIEWPRSHFGYRQQDVQEIVRVIDSAIARLQGGTPPPTFQVALFNAPVMTLEPLATMPRANEQLTQLLRIANGTRDVTERVALLQSAVALLATPGAISGTEAARVRRTVEDQLQREASIDQRYLRVSKDLLDRASRSAAKADVRNVERVMDRIQKEDNRLGQQRPEVVQALTASVQAQLDNARRLRLLRDQWKSRQAIFREYQRAVGFDLVQLVKARPALESIKKLDGPEPDRLDSLNRILRGGSVRLDRLLVPEYLRNTHELVKGAWRFAETAAASRLKAVSSADIGTAWEASSAAAGALMMLSLAQKELRALTEPPKLQ